MPETVLVLGSGPIRIGQGIEFDYSCVHCVKALQELGYRAVIVNNNPETVSTDFDTGDALYFEPVCLDDVRQIAQHESIVGVVTQFGGQTAINLAQGLHDSGIPVLGTSAASIAMAEDREQFDHLLVELSLPKPPGKAVSSLEQAHDVARSVGFPVLVRPSFVLGGRAMEIIYDSEHLDSFYGEAESANPGQPVLIDKYLLGKEAEVDVISDGEDTLVPGIMEHIERAGVHSGDSMAVYPSASLSHHVIAQMVVASCKIARALQVKGLMNIQFVIDSTNGDERAHVLEVNPRASRTVPYLSKVTGVPMVKLATQCMMGRKLRDLGYASGLWVGGAFDVREHSSKIASEAQVSSPDFKLPEPKLYAVKAPVFSFQKLSRVDPSLGPEMKSTGEILGIDRTYVAALYKALIASGIRFRPNGFVALSVSNADKSTGIEIARRLVARGYPLVTTKGTHEVLLQQGIRSTSVNKIQEGSPNLLDLIHNGDLALMINTPSPDRRSDNVQAMRIRRACIESGVACITSIDTAYALAQALDIFEDPSRAECLPYTDYLSQ